MAGVEGGLSIPSIEPSGGGMNFDTIAPFYQLLETVTSGTSVQRCRTRFLPTLATARDILLLGEGNGRFLVELLKRWPDKRITVVESSQRMLDLQRARLKRNKIDPASVSHIKADIREWDPPAEAYDAIVANFFLDCFRPIELQSLIHKLANGARPNALWLVADFAQPPQFLRGLRAAVILGVMYRFFRLTTKLDARRLTPPDQHLEDAGFTLHERQKRNWGLLHSDVWIHTGRH